MLRTKAAGEQSVFKEFPEVIIIFLALVMRQAMIIIA
jgi:hypothetical protein